MDVSAIDLTAFSECKKLSGVVEGLYRQGIKDPEKLLATCEALKEHLPILAKAGSITAERMERILGWLTDEDELEVNASPHM